ncbi:MAG: hypothetical protein JNL75_02185 [Chitinophagales bacterium]|nr:hypothetical protein [Chitinophagales bacterium]
MDIPKFLIYLHASLGGAALIAGLVAAFTVKGSKIHKKSGSVFHHTMVASVLISLGIALIPSHFSPFLFGIGVFSLYSVISGRRCLKVLKPSFNITIDKILAIGLILNCSLMIGLPIIVNGEVNIVLTVFGIFGLLAGVRDLRAFKDFEKYKKERIKHHINKISGGYIAAVTAFLVVNEVLPGYWSWFTPTIIGSIYATYYNIQWRRK